MTRREALTLFLQTVHPGETGVCELRAIPSEARQFVPLRSVEAVDAFLRQFAPTQNCYIGVASRRDATNGTLANCHELWTVFADIDFKDTPEGVARTRLVTFPLRPTLVIGSGGGWHCYWSLKDPFVLPGDAAAAKTILKRLALHFGGDDASAEAAHCLRIPGSVNHKPVYAQPRIVTIDQLDQVVC